MTTLTADAVVVGGGHHGLVAAALLADAGWDVCLLEATDHVGGAVRSAALHPGFTADLYSAFYPLYGASPVLQALDLEAHGLAWSHAPSVLAHPPRPDGARAAVLYRDREATAARLAAGAPARRRGVDRAVPAVGRGREPLLRTLFTTFPPVRGPVALLRTIGTADALRLARFLLLPARRMGEELFDGEEARLLLAGNAAHADAPGDAPVSGAYGWLLAMLGQHARVPGAGRGRRRAGGGARAAARRRPARRCTPTSGWSGSTCAGGGPSPCTPRPG